MLYVRSLELILLTGESLYLLTNISLLATSVLRCASMSASCFSWFRFFKSTLVFLYYLNYVLFYSVQDLVESCLDCIPRQEIKRMWREREKHDYLKNLCAFSIATVGGTSDIFTFFGFMFNVLSCTLLPFLWDTYHSPNSLWSRKNWWLTINNLGWEWNVIIRCVFIFR